MKKYKCLFSFGKINKYFIIPFLCPIFCFLRTFFVILYVEIPNENDIDKKINNKIYLLSSSASLSYFGGGLLYFISYIRSKPKHTNKLNENKKDRISSDESPSPFSIDYIYNDPLDQKYELKIFFILFIISLLEIFALIGNLFTVKKNVIEIRLYYLLLLPLFSKIILKSELFKHQILSLIMSIIGIILLIIPNALTIQKSDIIFNIWIIFISITRSFDLVMVKHLTHKYFLSHIFAFYILAFFLWLYYYLDSLFFI